jgi:hypothetical protein
MHTMKNTELYRLAGSLTQYSRMWGKQVSETLAKEIAIEHRDSEWMDFQEFCRFHRVDSKILLEEIA